MQKFSASITEMAVSFWQNRSLIWTLVVRDVASRYRGSLMGVLWSFFNPMFMLAVYTFVFSVVFKSRWNSASESRAEFALILFAGLLIFNLFSECLSRAPGLILSNVNYVKKVVFPLEILPWVSVGSALFQMMISLCVWTLFYLLLKGMPPLSMVLLPVLLVPLVLLTMGLSWMVASLGVYVRDISQLISIFLTALMFLTPIFYPIAALPQRYQQIIMLNPTTLVIEQVRGILFFGTMPDWPLFFVYAAISLMTAWAGFAWFQKTRKGFADVL